MIETSPSSLDRLLAQMERVKNDVQENHLSGDALSMEVEMLGDLLRAWGADVLQDQRPELVDKEILDTIDQIHDFFISLYNKYDQLEFSLRLMNILQAVFERKGVLSERFEKDLLALENEKQKRSLIRESVLENQKEYEHRKVQRSRAKLPLGRIILVLTLSVLAFFFYTGQYSGLHGDVAETILFHEPTVPMPENGFVEYYGKDKPVAPFSLKTSVESGYFYVLFRDVNTNKAAVTMFIYPDSVREIKMPLGSYTMYYAEGQKWYGTEHLFGPGTKLLKATMTMDFSIKGDTVLGNKVEMHQVEDGNLQTEKADLDEFKIE